MLKAGSIISMGEGYKSRPYKCTSDKWTWGHGRNYEDYPLSIDERLHVVKVCAMSFDPMTPWTTDQTTFILSNIDGDKAKNIANFMLSSVIAIIDLKLNEQFQWYAELDGPRRCVWLDWAYNMGLGQVCSFKNTIRLMAEKAYGTIAENARGWQWAKDVHFYPPFPGNPNGSRAWYILEMLKIGEYPKWA